MKYKILYIVVCVMPMYASLAPDAISQVKVGTLISPIKSTNKEPATPPSRLSEERHLKEKSDIVKQSLELSGLVRANENTSNSESDGESIGCCCGIFFVNKK